MSDNLTTFGVNPADTQPQISSLRGQAGWWTVPTQWFCYVDENNQRWASPNENRNPAYACYLDEDFTLKYFDTYRNRQLGIG